jgi:hypothetical protein
MDLMLNQDTSTISQTSDERENRIQTLIEQLRPNAEAVLRQMAERLVDLPENKSFGQIEYELRDLAHDLAANTHQTGLAAGKKRATSAPAASAPTARVMHASSITATKPG